MQPSTSAELTGSESSSGEGTSNPQNGSSIAQALGFVAEFNENALIFNQVLFQCL